ncbi:MAG: hypothetical protein GX748_17275, partial [Lentisphaerae bacterium]|nr:hypothetical protein [Lentisphaerota bacterium]
MLQNNLLSGYLKELCAVARQGDAREESFNFYKPKSITVESLAAELAKRTRFLRDVVGRQLVQEKDRPGVLAGFFEAFQTYLIGTLTTADF